ncbi:MAG: polysaccharide biosynthesis C-terminal domain-containing protein, partial [Bacteroidetes bacterium]|nr:polysaccharide biosynthesis C-terminal domain-containing protein [Bacteroidota bacterium]
VSLLVVNIAVIQIINEIYTGYALVYFIPKFSLKKIYTYGIIWTIVCTAICAIVMYVLFTFFDLGAGENWIHLVILSFIIILHSFHMVIILAKERIRAYNFLNFLQPALLLSTLVVMFFYFHHRTVDSYIIALYVSFLTAIALSGIQVFHIFKHQKTNLPLFEPKHIVENGFYNQLANLCHMLSNRYNFYLLGNTILVGIYSSSSSLIESVWIISGSVSPIILTFIANAKDPANNARITFLLSKICFLLSLACVVVLYFIPRDFFVYLLGEDFIHVKTVMLYLSPGILLISFATIISHYFAGLGKQKTLLMANSFGLLATVCTSHYFVSRYQLLGACYATIISYFVATAILVFVFMKQNRFGILDLLSFKKDFNLLRKS